MKTSINVWMMDAHKDVIFELGRVTMRWASLDLQLVDILDAALDNREAAYQCIFGEANAGQQRFRAFERVIGASSFDQATRTELIGHMKKIGRLYKERNDIVHRPLDTSFLPGEGRKLKTKVVSVGRDGKRRDLKIDDLRKHCDVLDEILNALEHVGMVLSAKWASETPTAILK